MNEYEDIIHLEHHTSARHPRMPMSARAAQFAAFAALSGHDAAISSTATHYQEEVEAAERGVDIDSL